MTQLALYRLALAAEKTDEWNYVLNDGAGVPRQLTDMAGVVTLSTRYNPWGKPIEIDGTGNFDASFIGTLIDATTGLIYIGNGQYYDPETGRFLTRGVNPNSTNPSQQRFRQASRFVTMLVASAHQILDKTPQIGIFLGIGEQIIISNFCYNETDSGK